MRKGDRVMHWKQNENSVTITIGEGSRERTMEVMTFSGLAEVTPWVERGLDEPPPT